ncbi:MAG: cupin domain-containing protein [Acidimicrobiia bacterium]|nr:cupin domain-containing protein [Acidimicrobiia bacterium]
MTSGSDRFEFGGLFVCEMANNHQGSAAHGIRIVDAVADVAREAGVRAAVKLQFRELDSFIHPAHRSASSNKHIRRFLETRLPTGAFAEIVGAVKQRGLTAIATPFDEPSVETAIALGIDVLKIASCSAHDWPLLEAVAATGKPVVCSTGGLSVADTDKTVSFLQHRGVHLALMHCVSLYPTPPDRQCLDHIEVLRERYPGIPVGFSTHERPDDYTTIRVAYAKGACLFEKHVGIPTDSAPLNSYSATPEQLRCWLHAYRDAVALCGGGARVVTEQEESELRALERGVFAKRPLRRGATLTREDVFFAMPASEGQLDTSLWRAGLVADADYDSGAPLRAAIRPVAPTQREIIYNTIHAVKGLLNQARIPVGYDVASIELSHHHGLGEFGRIGCTIIECFNREYAKKVIVQLPGQRNPLHYHKRKDETFHVLHGVLDVEIEGTRRTLHPGDSLWVPRGIVHGFETATGAIFEEISTHAEREDSFYNDPVIAAMPLESRKTRLDNWGRHQFDDWDEGAASPDQA